MSILSIAQIPTVSSLYRQKNLLPADSERQDQLYKSSQSLNDRIGLIRGDITLLEVDAIVNAANESLLGGGGVDGAIHRGAGPGLLRECRTLNGCETGSAKITGAYELPCRKVIHAVGPVYDSRYKDECRSELAGCYTTSLRLAVDNNCKSIAFSALSTGIYGYPSDAAAPVAIQAVKNFLEGPSGDKLDKVIFTTFVSKDVNAYNKWLPHFFPPTEADMQAEDSEWEEVEGGDSAENGPTQDIEAEGKKPSEEKEDKESVEGRQSSGEITAAATTLPVETMEVDATEKSEPGTKADAVEGVGTAEHVDLVAKFPDVPTSEPGDDGPATKKQKNNDEEQKL